MKSYVKKILFSNDLGENGSHQAGIHIPKKSELLHFFPELDADAVNPYIIIHFLDSFDRIWKFKYIYYNNKFRGGTRNEFRLTGMTKFFRENNALIGDVITFSKNENDYFVDIEKTIPMMVDEDDDDHVTLELTNGWKVISF